MGQKLISHAVLYPARFLLIYESIDSSIARKVFKGGYDTTGVQIWKPIVASNQYFFSIAYPPCGSQTDNTPSLQDALPCIRAISFDILIHDRAVAEDLGFKDFVEE